MSRIMSKPCGVVALSALPESCSKICAGCAAAAGAASATACSLIAAAQSSSEIWPSSAWSVSLIGGSYCCASSNARKRSILSAT